MESLKGNLKELVTHVSNGTFKRKYKGNYKKGNLKEQLREHNLTSKRKIGGHFKRKFEGNYKNYIERDCYKDT